MKKLVIGSKEEKRVSAKAVGVTMFKGKAMLVIDGEFKPFQVSINKAKAILSLIGDIRDFAEGKYSDVIAQLQDGQTAYFSE